MKIILNDYYIEHIKNIIGILNNSQPGKRMWTLDPVTGTPNYSLTERSTFPSWLSFWFEKPHKKERFEYFISGRKPYEDGYFNGSTPGLHKMLNKALNKGEISKSKRIQKAFDIILDGYFDEMYYLEEQYMEECPF